MCRRCQGTRSKRDLQFASGWRLKWTASWLLGDVRTLITSARETVSRGVNTALVLLYRKVGGRILLDILKEKRAGYGDRIVSALATQLNWMHFVDLLPLNKPHQRDFYAEMCA